MSTDEGLANNTVPCIYKDHDGFLWFGTYDGLDRYDGYVLKKYRHIIGDTNSLGQNLVLSIAQDKCGCHWVATGNGVFVLSARTDRFSVAYILPFKKGSEVVAPQRLSNQVNTIVEDQQGNILAGTQGAGLCLFKAGTRIGWQIPLCYRERMSSNYQVTAIARDSAGRTWLYIDSVGLCRFDGARDSIIVVNEDNVRATCLSSGKGDTLWAGTKRSIVLYNTRSGSESALSPGVAHDIPSTKINSINEDNKGYLWIATDGNGLQVFDLNNHNLVPIQEFADGEGLSSNAIYCIYRDEQDQKWIGTFRGGIDVLSSGREAFYSISRRNGSNNTLAGNFVFSFCQDPSGRIWIGTDGSGISIWDRHNNSYKTYPKGPGRLPCNNVTDLLTDRQGSIWVTTYGGGVGRINPSTGAYHAVTSLKDSACIFAWRLYQDREGTVWMGVFRQRGGLYRYEPSTGNFVLVNSCGEDVLAITEDRNGYIWAGGSTGLFCLDRNGKILRHIETHATVRSITEGRDGAIWVGTQGHGLLRVTGPNLRYYVEQQGLSNNNVLNILEDDQGILWLSTYYGLNKFTPSTGKFENFFYEDGLQNNQFYYNAAFKSSSGDFYFGGIKGFTVFHPRDSLPAHSFPPVVITGVRIMNEPVDSVGGRVKGASIARPTSIVVPYEKAVLSIDFSALEYALPGKIKYAYYLQGWDKSWFQAGSQKTANYSELREGDYILFIRSTNAEGTWNKTAFSLPIHVLPPWYRTWWAQTMFALAILSILGLLLYYWQRQVRARYALSVTEWKHRKEMELNEKRLSFFTNISHELRSPLSLIINPIREMLKNDNSNPDSFNLGIIYSNAQRLLKMTDRLLMFRKVDNELGEPQREPVDLLNLCRQVFFCFGEEARAKSLRYTFNSSLGQSMTYADPEKIEIIIYNIIANAVKFCPKTGEVDVNLEETGDNFILSIRDSGPGIPPKLGDRLFEKYTQAPVGDPAGLQKGFGIGMYLAKALTDMHQGELSYECPPSGGTIFRLGLKRLNDPISSPITAVEKGRDDEARTGDLPSSFKEKSDSSTVMLDELVSNRKILLVVDDDRQVTAYIRHIFPDLMVYETASAEEGLEKVQQITPDIIISDILMGGADGLEFCKKMKAGSLAYIPIIFLTSHGAADMRLKGAESGADEFITKPFEVDLLRARVYHILKDRELLKKYFFNEITLQSNPLKISDEYSGFLAACIAIVQEHIDRDDFDSKLFAKLMGMSRSRLYTKVKSISGLSVSEFVKLIRLRKAAELMIHTNGQIKEISFQVGFNDAKSFREQFTRLFGIKPSEYIRKYRKNFQDNRNLNEQFAQIKGK